MRCVRVLRLLIRISYFCVDSPTTTAFLIELLMILCCSGAQPRSEDIPIGRGVEGSATKPCYYKRITGLNGHFRTVTFEGQGGQKRSAAASILLEAKLNATIHVTLILRTLSSGHDMQNRHGMALMSCQVSYVSLQILTAVVPKSLLLRLINPSMCAFTEPEPVLKFHIDDKAENSNKVAFSNMICDGSEFSNN